MIEAKTLVAGKAKAAGGRSLGDLSDKHAAGFAKSHSGGCMEAIISNLLNRFESGALTRRSLIQGLAMLTAASGTPSGVQVPDAAIKAARIDHMSIQEI